MGFSGGCREWAKRPGKLGRNALQGLYSPGAGRPCSYGGARGRAGRPAVNVSQAGADVSSIPLVPQAPDLSLQVFVDPDICRQHKTANPKRLISGAMQAGL